MRWRINENLKVFLIFLFMSTPFLLCECIIISSLLKDSSLVDIYFFPVMVVTFVNIVILSLGFHFAFFNSTSNRLKGVI